MSDLGNLWYFLGMEFKDTSKGSVLASKEVCRGYFEKIQNKQLQLSNHIIGVKSKVEQGYKWWACKCNLVQANH